jgi:subtilisin family serine protease
MAPLRGLLLVVVASVGCGGGGGGTPQSSPDPRHNVLVIDDGFDLTVPVFNGRVAATYSIACLHSAPAPEQDQSDAAGLEPVADAGAPPAEDGGTAPGADGGLADRKASLLAALKVRDTSCHLEPGVVAKPDPLASIARFRDRWNKTILASRYASTAFTQAEIDEIKAAMAKLDNARFHGTATAGLIAHQNPAVRLVLVEELLGSAQMAEQGFNCFQQQDIDDNVTLFTDAEVRQAYIDQPVSQLEEDLLTLESRHHLGVVNESFGSFSRQRLEELQMGKGCAPVDLRRYFSVLGELDAARALAHPDPGVLTVKSAGNDHSELDGPEDHPMCNMDGSIRLVVGAYDDQGQLTSFTNFGHCVDTIAPGSQIITPIPGNWYLPLSGTSFSAPLTVRLISVNPQPVPYDPAQARALVLSMRDAEGRIPLSRFPHEVLYDPQMLSGQWALRLAEPTPVEPPLVNLRKLREFQRLLRPGRR